MAVSEMIPPAAAPAFLARAGWSGAVIAPLAGDASFRRYFRVTSTNGTRAVLMDAPAPHEDPRPFIAIAKYLSGHGFRAPTIIASDLELGLVLIEDFGDRLMRAEIEAAPDSEFGIYSDCIDLIVDLHRHSPADLPPYSEAVYLRETGLLTEWTVPALGVAVDEAGYDAAWRSVLAPVLADAAKVTVLRDYHAENIMLLGGAANDGAGPARLGLLDFQDALVGHPAYDLVSLLQDARRDVSPGLEAAMLDRYCAATGQGDAFRAHYAILGAQRNAKIIGIFTRLARRDGKHRYLSMIPRMWALLDRDLAHSALAPVAGWFVANIPADVRAMPLVTAD
jgi:N-acetylmuramate 1-kinase